MLNLRARTPRDFSCFATPMHNDWSLSFTQDLSKQASAYWEYCRGDRAMPVARDLKPREMKAFLPHVMLVSVLSSPARGCEFKVRLAGEAARGVFGNVTDKFIDEFFPPEIEERWRFAFEAVCNQKAPIRNYGTVAFKHMNWLDYEVLVAPLGDRENVSDLFVVFLSWHGESYAL